MPLYESEMTAKDIKSLAIRHGIPLDPVALTKRWIMDQLPDDMIGLYEQKAIPDAMAWRHHDSNVNDPVPEDGFNALDVQTLTKWVVDLRPVPSGFFFWAAVTMYEYLRFPFLSGAHADEGESSRNQAYYVPNWSIRQRCRVDTPMWCHELMVHLPPPTAQEESNALTNATALKRAWFNLGRGALAQTDILERELKDELARKDSAPVYAERINDERAQEKEKTGPRWDKGLIKERSKEDISELISKMKGFDPYADKKMFVKYDKLFEKRYPYVEKFSCGFCHTVYDLLKVYPDSLPAEQAPLSKPSTRKAPSSSAPNKS
uniref:Uncharacterized protein n=1 Tax=Tanacetum cinerariifolium TaxID=118510 RepID=A0A6L2LZB5_TANCI|nr:hypothetical protein [Tanacetum cinerariifolium]